MVFHLPADSNLHYKNRRYRMWVRKRGKELSVWIEKT